MPTSENPSQKVTSSDFSCKPAEERTVKMLCFEEEQCKACLQQKEPKFASNLDSKSAKPAARSTFHYWTAMFSSVSILLTRSIVVDGASSSWAPQRLYQIPTDAFSEVSSAGSGVGVNNFHQEAINDEDNDWALSTLRQVLDIPSSTPPNQRRIPPPQYMLDLYNQIADPNGLTIGENPYGAKIVRSYRMTPSNDNNNRRKRAASTGNPTIFRSNGTEGLVLEYFLSGVRPMESLIEAELHLFRSKHFVGSRVGKNKVEFYQIHVHELVDSSQSSKPPEAFHITTHLVSSRDGQRWELFKVGTAASLTGRPWHRVPSMSTIDVVDSEKFPGSADVFVEQPGAATVKFLVTASTVDNKPLPVIGSLGRHSKQPFLVIYNDDGGSSRTSNVFGENSGTEARFKRSTSSETSSSSTTSPSSSTTDAMIPMQETSSTSTTTNAPSSTSSSTLSASSSTTSEPSTTSTTSNPSSSSTTETPATQNFPCQRLPMYVNFELIGLENIISPKGYQAYWCHGLCSYPLGQEVSPSNHATVQSFAHHMGLITSLSPEERGQRRRSRVPPIPVAPPCCVPSSLMSVSILFYGEDGNVALRQYDDMVAGGCSCQ